MLRTHTYYVRTHVRRHIYTDTHAYVHMLPKHTCHVHTHVTYAHMYVDTFTQIRTDTRTCYLNTHVTYTHMLRTHTCTFRFILYFIHILWIKMCKMFYMENRLIFKFHYPRHERKCYVMASTTNTSTTWLDLGNNSPRSDWQTAGQSSKLLPSGRNYECTCWQSCENWKKD